MGISGFHDENGPWSGRPGAVRRAYKAKKRAEAEERNAKTPSSRRKKVRKGTVARKQTAERRTQRRHQKGKR